jgi:uncharacterized protein YcbX
MDEIEVGIVRALTRYPVKAMPGEDVEEAWLAWHGLEGDRRYAFVRADTRSDFPWLTIRELPALLGYRPAFAEPGAPEGSGVVVQTPTGRILDATDPELTAELAGLHGGPLHVLRSKRGLFDALPVSVITTATIGGVGRGVGLTLDPRRFRPNVLVEPTESSDAPEQAWIGSRLTFGDRPDSARVRIDKANGRCVVVSTDPDDGSRDPAVLREVAQRRSNLAGVYASTERPGTIAVGDVLRLAP